MNGLNINKGIFTIAVLLLSSFLYTSCTKTEIEETSDKYVASTVPMDFKAESGASDNNWESPHTRASEIKSTFKKDDVIGLFAYYLPDGTYNENSRPNFFYDQSLIAGENGSDFTYSPTKYWPASTDSKIKFFAYYPHSANASVTISDDTKNSQYPKLQFIPNTDVKKQVDFMTAYTGLLDKSCGQVKFTNNDETDENKKSSSFTHQLSQVSFSAKYKGVEGARVYITNIQLEGVKNPQYGQFSIKGFEWSDSFQESSPIYNLSTDNGNLIDIVAGKDQGYLNTETFTNICHTPEGFLMLPPQKFTTSSNIKLTISFRYAKNETSNYIDAVETINVTKEHSYNKGTKTNYKITIDTSNILSVTLSDIVIESWIDGGPAAGNTTLE